MKKIILILLLAAGLTGMARAEEEGFPWDKAPNKVNDLPALQTGAKLFTNYCLSCHSAAFMRYTRLTDIGLTQQQIKDNLMFTTDKIGETMKVNMDPREAKEWFGATPPDLTLIARSRAGKGGSGPDYLYTYLRTFYRDPGRPTGWNNLVFPKVGMPNVLWELQGDREPVFEAAEEHGQKIEVFKGWKQTRPGTMTAQQYDEAVADLVAYLQWMGEPAQNTRVRVGVWVLLFLVVFTVIAWRLNAAYWKDVT